MQQLLRDDQDSKQTSIGEHLTADVAHSASEKEDQDNERRRPEGRSDHDALALDNSCH